MDQLKQIDLMMQKIFKNECQQTVVNYEKYRTKLNSEFVENIINNYDDNFVN